MDNTDVSVDNTDVSVDNTDVSVDDQSNEHWIVPSRRHVIRHRTDLDTRMGGSSVGFVYRQRNQLMLSSSSSCSQPRSTKSNRRRKMKPKSAKTDVSVDETDVSVDETDVSVDETDVSVDETDVSVDETDVSVDETDVTVLPLSDDCDGQEDVFSTESVEQCRHALTQLMDVFERKVFTCADSLHALIRDMLSNRVFVRLLKRVGEWTSYDDMIQRLSMHFRGELMKYEASKMRLDRRLTHFMCAAFVYRTESFLSELRQHMLTDKSVLRDIHTLRLSDVEWEHQVEYHFDIWNSLMEGEAKSSSDATSKSSSSSDATSLFTVQATKVWYGELAHAFHLLKLRDKPDAVYRFLTVHTIYPVTRLAYGWSTKVHDQQVKQWMFHKMTELRLPLVCLTCWQSECPPTAASTGGTGAGVCRRCHSIYYCSRKCQSEDWKHHRMCCSTAT